MSVNIMVSLVDAQFFLPSLPPFLPIYRIPKAAKSGHILKGTISYVKNDNGKKAVSKKTVLRFYTSILYSFGYEIIAS